jgi:protein TonB
MTDAAQASPEDKSVQANEHARAQSRNAWAKDDYKKQAERCVHRAWFPPNGLKRKPVEVGLTVHRDGTVSDTHVEKSSGSATIDAAALKAVKNAAPFRPLPPEAPDSVELKFSFD